MIPYSNLEDIEKKAWLSTFEDGFYDIILGMLFILFAVTPIIRMNIGLWYIPIVVIFPGIFATLLLYFGKRIITAPRIGFAKFGIERQVSQRKSVKMSIVTFIALVILVTITALSKSRLIEGGISGVWIPVSIAIGVVILLNFKARLSGIPRLTVYGFIIGGGILCVEIVRNVVGDPWHYMISFGIPGVIALSYGIRLLVTFIHKYPIPAEESAYEPKIKKILATHSLLSVSTGLSTNRQDSQSWRISMWSKARISFF